MSLCRAGTKNQGFCLTPGIGCGKVAFVIVDGLRASPSLGSPISSQGGGCVDAGDGLRDMPAGRDLAGAACGSWRDIATSIDVETCWIFAGEVRSVSCFGID